MNDYPFVFYRILRRFSLNILFHTPSPLLLTVLVTTRCGMNCPICIRKHEGVKGDESISLDNVKWICGEKIPFVLLAGGEPTDHPDIEEIVRLLRGKRIKTYMFTNGMHHSILDTLLRQNPNLRLFISFNSDDSESERNEKIRSLAFCKMRTKYIYSHFVLKPGVNNDWVYGVSGQIASLIKRIYMSEYIDADCTYSPVSKDSIQQYAKAICKTNRISVTVQRRVNPESSPFMYKLLAKLEGADFIGCSGYPFRAIMNERGELFPCYQHMIRSM